MSIVKNNMVQIAIIEDATKRIGDRIVPLLLSGELAVEDEYINYQVKIIREALGLDNTNE